MFDAVLVETSEFDDGFAAGLDSWSARSRWDYTPRIFPEEEDRDGTSTSKRTALAERVVGNQKLSFSRRWEAVIWLPQQPSATAVRDLELAIPKWIPSITRIFRKGCGTGCGWVRTTDLVWMVRHLEPNPAAVRANYEMRSLAEPIDISRADPNSSAATLIHNRQVNPVIATASWLYDPQQRVTDALKVASSAIGSDDGKMQIDEGRDSSELSQVKSSRRFVYYHLQCIVLLVVFLATVVGLVVLAHIHLYLMWF